jgi:hypothetical protein
MWTPFIYAAILVLVFGGYLYLCEREERVGKRLLLAGVRHRLDTFLTHITEVVNRGVRYVVKYVITLSWYYSLHTFLKLAMRSLAGVYHLLESILIRNRERARALRRERRLRRRIISAILPSIKKKQSLLQRKLSDLRIKRLKGTRTTLLD